MAAGLALQLAFSNYVLTVCRALRLCKESWDLHRILRGLLDLVTFAREDSSELRNAEPATEASQLPESLRVLHHELVLSRDASVHVTLAFCQHLEVIICSMLPGRGFFALLLLC